MWCAKRKCRTIAAKKLQKQAILLKNSLFFCGRSAGTRTLGLLLPKQARYQLRNTPIFNKTPLYYSILGRFRKAFLIMVKIVGWLQKCANFRKTKTRKPLCRKALRHFQKMGLTKSYYVPKQARYQLR